MSRRARLDQTESLHHVMARTVERRALFVDDTDRVAFLDFLSQASSLSGTSYLAWAFMNNHVHLLLRCSEYPLSSFMQMLLSRYARYFNRRHARTGHLFESRFRSILVNDESYLLTVVRYIHLNPIVSGAIPDLEALSSYPWTGHRSVLTGTAPTGQDVAGVLSLYRTDRGRALENYMEMLKSDSPAWVYAGEGFLLGKNGVSCARISDLLSEKTIGSQRVLCDRESAVELARSLKREGSGLIRDREWTHVKIEEILRETLSRFDLSAGALTGESRRGSITQARAYAARRLVDEAGLSMTHAGRLLGITRQGILYLLNCKL